MIEHAAAETPAKTAIVVVDKDDPRRTGWGITYEQLAALVRATANRMCAVSGATPPVVSILTPLTAEAFIASWAGAAVGVANPINPFLRIEHVANIMKAAGTTVLVCGSAADGPGAWNEVASLRTLVPTLREVWSVGHASTGDFQHQIARGADERLSFDRIEQHAHPAALLHTGGTTSTPKLVQLSERGMLLNAWCTAALNHFGLGEVVAVGMPYFHAAGAINLALASIVMGQTMVIVGPDGYRSARLIARFWDLVEAHGITLAGCAPTTAAAIVATAESSRPPRDFRCWAGGAPVPIQVAREFAEKFGVPLREGWGMTELHGGLAFNPPGPEPRLGSIGIPFPYHRARCIPLGAGTADARATPGTMGVLAINGPCVTSGYSGRAHSSELFLASSDPEEQWLNTGDLCTIDSDGYIWLRGRLKDLIIRGGHNIDPLAIESALLAHPAVLYAAAIGEPDRDKGEVPVAYVQLRPGMSASESELLGHCQGEITERAAVPRAVRIVEAMPLTAVGKIFKPALRREAVQRCVGAVAAKLDGAGRVNIDVRDVSGSIVVVLKPIDLMNAACLDTIRSELERYPFQVEVNFSDVNGTPAGSA
jgi:fatty-acyl-CoA synthase